MEISVDTLIEQAVEWLSKKNAVYVTKEDKVYWYESITGRDIDATWQSASLDQVKRMIGFRQDYTTTEIIITALQELGVIYEVSISSEYEVPSHVFNFSAEVPDTTMDIAVCSLMRYMKKANSSGMLDSDIRRILSDVFWKSSIEYNAKGKNQALSRNARRFDFTHKFGTGKINYQGRKEAGLLRKGHNHKAIKVLDEEEITIISRIITRSIKQ